MVVSSDVWGESEDDLEFFHNLMQSFESKTNIKKDGIIFIVETLNHTLFKTNAITDYSKKYDDTELTIIANGLIEVPVYIKELIDAFVELSLEKFGGLALYTINKWGIHTTKDIGRCIASFIESDQFVKSRMFSKTKQNEIISQFEDLIDLNDKLSMEKYITNLSIP